MIGAIAGDVIGSVFEFNNTLSTSFPLFGERSHFTDDTVLTVAVADCLLGRGDFVSRFKLHGRKYPRAGYGCNFYTWLFSDDTRAYNSFGNGSAMRVAPIGFACETLEDTLRMARESAEVTHNHPEGIKGAQAVAAAIFLARTGASKSELKSEIHTRFGYSLERSLDDIRPSYFFNETCPGSVPEAITAFLESSSYEDAVRLSVSIGGDSDTIACIAGGIAQSFYGGVPLEIVTETCKRLPSEFIDIIGSFEECYGISHGLRDSMNSAVI
jgi:ADP-ribosyl-[dinitrogen reductase] hydrolase